MSRAKFYDLIWVHNRNLLDLSFCRTSVISLTVNFGNSYSGRLRNQNLYVSLYSKLNLTLLPFESYIYISRLWFQTCFIFTPTWGNDPI